MADFQLKVTAETQRAEKDLQRLGITADSATKDRKLKIDVSELNKNFKDVQNNVKEASNTIQTFYRISKNIPGIGDRVREFENLAKGTADLAKNAPASAAALRENAKAGSILANSFEAAGAGASRLVSNLAKTGLAIFALKEAAGLLKSTFGGFFNETIGREVKLRETILKTQTTLASTNKVFRNGSEITDPYEKIVALTGEVNKRVDSIRERSIALAGVTSGEVIEVFGIVASQIGQIGGGLKEAEDLAINFAAALGTFGIPLYQARQEVGSILRGDITTDSYLAKALGITNEDVAKAKSQAGGVVKFLEERLAAAVAGQKIAAQGFAGVVSNIKDLTELVSQKFGAGLLDPLLGGLTKIFDFLFKIREEVFAIASGMGRGLGQLLSTNLSIIGGGSALFGQIGAGAEGFAASLAESVKKAFVSLQSDANAVIAPVRNLLEEVTKSIGLLVEGLAQLAKGFISIKIENFKALVQIFSNLSETITIFSAGLSQVLKLYGQILQVPFVQYLSQLTTQFQLLEKLGVMSAVKLGFAAAGLIAAWQPIVTFFQALAARIAGLIGGVVIAVGAAFTRMGALIAAFAGTLTATSPAVEVLKTQLMGLSTALNTSGVSAEKAGASIARLGGATTAAVKTISTAVFGFIKFNLMLLAIQVGITALIDLFGRWQQAQDKAISDTRAEVALRRLNTTYKDIGDSANEATKRARAFEVALVDAKYNEATENLEKVRKKIQEIRDLTSDNQLDFGDYARRLAQLFNPANFDALQQQRKGELFSDAVFRVRQQQERQAATEQARWAQEINKKAAEENIRLEADKRINLEKEIGDIKKQQEDQLFQLRQQHAQKEVEIFRAAGELRIFQMEEANKKLIEGEEGASRSALEALNNYLSVRERGELDIESGKKQLNIEAANLERQISDYRLENEKKIAEIRKRAGDYEKNVSDYRRQLAGQSTPIGGATGLTQGNTGTSSSGPHFHVAGAASEAEARAIFAPDINRKLQLTDSPGSPRGGGRRHAGYDLAGPAGTPLNLAQGYSLTDFTRDPKGLGGNYATIAGPNNKSYKVMHLQDPGSSYKGPGSTTAAPEAPSFADVGAPAVEKYASAVRSLAGAMERFRVLQEALTNAKTAAAFDEIAKAAFPKVSLEQYQDRLTELGYTYAAIASNKAQAFNPERSAIEVARLTQAASANRELQQIITGIGQQAKLSDAEKAKAIDAITKKHAEYLRNLETEAIMKQRIVSAEQTNNLINSLSEKTKGIYAEIEATKLRNRLTDEGVRPELIDAELAKLEISREVNRLTADLTKQLGTQLTLRDELATKLEGSEGKEKAKLEKDLAAALAEIERLRKQIEGVGAAGSAAASAVDANAKVKTEPGRKIKDFIAQATAELNDLEAVAIRVSQGIGNAIGDSLAQGITGLIAGTTTAQEVFSSFLKRMGEILIGEATKMIATYVAIGLAKAFAGLASGGSGGSSSMNLSGTQTFNVPVSQMPAGMAFAEGGFVTGPTRAMIGEAGDSEYVIPSRKMPEAMARYSAGARGGSVIPANGGDAMSGGGNGGGAFTLETVVINNVEYATVEQVRALSQQAASQGAQGGFNRSMRTLQNSRSQRARIGLR